MNRRRHNRQPRTVQDFVRAGVLRPVQPVSASGYTAYGTGRELRPTGAEAASLLRVMYGLGSTAGTIAFRFVPQFAGNDNATQRLFYGYVAANDRVRFFKDTANKIQCAITDGTDTASSLSAAQSWASGTVHYVVGRWTWAATADVNLDGTNATQGDASAVAAQTCDSIYVGHATTPAPTFVGPVIVSPTRKSDAWVAAIQASSGAAYQSIPRLVRDFVAVGDLLLPLVDNSTAYLRVV